MRILLTGSSGRIGSEIAKSLINDNHSIIGVDTNPGEYTTHQFDISNKENLLKLTEGIDIIIHTAAFHAPHIKNHSKEEFWEINVKGTQYLLEACQKNKIPRFIFASSTSIYGKALENQNQAIWVTENLTPIPRDIYDETKLEAERLCEKVSCNTLSCISLRISRCFEEPENLMAIYRLYRGIDIRDVVKAFKLAITSNISGYAVFNISNETPFKESDTLLLKKQPKKVILNYYPEALEHFESKKWNFPKMIDRVYVIEKAKKILGFEPQYNFLKFCNIRKKIIKKEDSMRFKNSPSCIAYEYPFEDPDINIAYVEINGRYPDEGYVLNTISKEILFVTNGIGKITIDKNEYKIKKGDAFFIYPNQRYFINGNLKLLVPCSPSWNPQQYQKIT